MNYVGKIDSINHIVASDPCYEEDIWCRYERDNINGKDWFVELKVNKEEEGYNFLMLLKKNKENSKFIKNDIEYLSDITAKEYKIGMDTACVVLGINEIAEKSKKYHDEWQPSSALRTGSDGLFGYILEGTKNDELQFVSIDGYISEDMIDEQEIIDYLKTNFEIKDLIKESESNYEL